MPSIYLLRHGKAAFGADDYDQLDPLGVEQSRRLGQALAGCGLREPLFFSGAMQRHEQTMRECFGALGGGRHFEVDSRWNEFDHRQIIERAFPQHADLAQLRVALAKEPDPNAAFQRLFDTALTRWSSGLHDAEYSEPWHDFLRRVREALQDLARRLEHGHDAVVSTSGGPIAAAMSHVLALADTQALSLNRVIVNASYTRLLCGRQLLLASFNVHAHLDGPGYLTYR